MVDLRFPEQWSKRLRQASCPWDTPLPDDVHIRAARAHQRMRCASLTPPRRSGWVQRTATILPHPQLLHAVMQRSSPAISEPGAPLRPIWPRQVLHGRRAAGVCSVIGHDRRQGLKLFTHPPERWAIMQHWASLNNRQAGPCGPVPRLPGVAGCRCTGPNYSPISRFQSKPV
jgi:hypothetical protein